MHEQSQTLCVCYVSVLWDFFLFFPFWEKRIAHNRTHTTHTQLNLCLFSWLPVGLRQLSMSELTETLEEVETAIRRYSEELIQALALRDELDYEKEVLGNTAGRRNCEQTRPFLH